MYADWIKIVYAFAFKHAHTHTRIVCIEMNPIARFYYGIYVLGYSELIKRFGLR